MNDLDMEKKQMVSQELLQAILQPDKLIEFVGDRLNSLNCLPYGNKMMRWVSVIPEEGLMSECLDWIRSQNGSLDRSIEGDTSYVLTMPAYSQLFDEGDDLLSVIKACEYVFEKMNKQED